MVILKIILTPFSLLKKHTRYNPYPMISLRGSNDSASTPRGREAPEFDGRVGRVGRVDGWDGPEKCPLNFLKHCGHLELVYI